MAEDKQQPKTLADEHIVYTDEDGNTYTQAEFYALQFGGAKKPKPEAKDGE